MRNGYEELVSSATELCSKWGISIIQENKHKKFAKRQYDSIDNDKRIYTIEENFLVSVFLPLTDTAIFQLQERSKGTSPAQQPSVQPPATPQLQLSVVERWIEAMEVSAEAPHPDPE